MHRADAQRDDGVAARLYYVLLAATAALVGIFVLVADFELILAIIPDDAGYYFGIAENMAGGTGETFDGLNATNGYQPLWMYLLSAAYRMHAAAPETMYRAALLLQTMILAAAAVLLYRWCVRFFPPRVVLPGAMIFLVLVMIPAVNGMESAVLVTLLAVLVVLGCKLRVNECIPFTRDLLFGITAGLVVLARLDMIFLPIVVCALCLWRGITVGPDRTGYVRKAVAIGLGTALIVSPYLMRNYLAYGRIMPVSGALKSTFPRVAPSGYGFSRMALYDRAALAVAFVYLAWMVVRVRRRGEAARGRPRQYGNDAAGRQQEEGGTAARPGDTHRTAGLDYFEVTVAVLSATVLLHFFHTVFFMKWAVFRWHFLVYSFTAALALCVPAARFFGGATFERVRGVYWACVAALAVFCCLVVDREYGGRSTEVWGVASYRAACWAREHTEADAVFAMKDAGNFGYFSRRSVINLDGVVNSMAYQETIRRRRLNAYFSEVNVGYLVQHAFWDRDDINDGTYEEFETTYTSHLYGVRSDPVSLRQEWEVYRSEPYFDGPYRTVFLIWKLGGRE